jgi:hypothetical protein
MIKRAPLEIPPAVARQFMADLQAYYAEDDAVKRDEIAGRQFSSSSPVPEATRKEV